MNSIEIHRLSVGTVYRIFLIGLMWGAVPIYTLLGILAFLGLVPLNWNGAPIEGFGAVLAGPFMGLFFALLMTAIAGSVAALGLWLHSFYTDLRLYFVTSFAPDRGEG